jgi:hypothetical protein
LVGGFIILKGENMKKMFLAVVVVLAAFFSGCSSSDDSTPPSGNLNGTVAIGEGLASQISVVDSTGVEVTTTSDASGAYSALVEAANAPYIIRAVADSGIVLYSHASGTGVANVTPITTYVMDRVARNNSYTGGVTQLFGDFANASVSADDINFVVTSLNTVLGDRMGGDLASFDHFSSEFAANHAGYDALLDALDVSIDGDYLIIRVDSEVLHTLDETVYGDVSGSIEVQAVGTIRNRSDESVVVGATVAFSATEVNASSGADGAFSATLDGFRTYDATVSAEGFHSVNVMGISTFTHLTSVNMGTVYMIPSSNTGNGTVAGTMMDGRTGDELEGVSLTFRAGINNRSGTVAATATTDGEGAYSVTLPVGTYTAMATLDEYSTTYFTVYSLGIGEPYTEANGSIFLSNTAYNNANAFATIQLTWGEEPQDLDSHLTGPDGDSRFHIYYSDQYFTDSGVTDYFNGEDFNASNPCATAEIKAALDLDDTESYGPETTTICQVENGTYNFYVHHYSGDNTISDSPAVVTVTTAAGITRTYTAPSGATGSDSDVWHVFSIDSNGVITPVNTIAQTGTASLASARDTQIGFEKEIFVNLPAK